MLLAMYIRVLAKYQFRHDIPLVVEQYTVEVYRIGLSYCSSVQY
jgi:hypothetical protein